MGLERRRNKEGGGVGIRLRMVSSGLAVGSWERGVGSERPSCRRGVSVGSWEGNGLGRRSRRERRKGG